MHTLTRIATLVTHIRTLTQIAIVVPERGSEALVGNRIAKDMFLWDGLS